VAWSLSGRIESLRCGFYELGSNSITEFTACSSELLVGVESEPRNHQVGVSGYYSFKNP
jgi:hypothetical protein